MFTPCDADGRLDVLVSNISERKSSKRPRCWNRTGRNYSEPVWMTDRDVGLAGSEVSPIVFAKGSTCAVHFKVSPGVGCLGLAC